MSARTHARTHVPAPSAQSLTPQGGVTHEPNPTKPISCCKCNGRHEASQHQSPWEVRASSIGNHRGGRVVRGRRTCCLLGYLNVGRKACHHGIVDEPVPELGEAEGEDSPRALEAHLGEPVGHGGRLAVDGHLVRQLQGEAAPKVHRPAGGALLRVDKAFDRDVHLDHVADLLVLALLAAAPSPAVQLDVPLHVPGPHPPGLIARAHHTVLAHDIGVDLHLTDRGHRGAEGDLRGAHPLPNCHVLWVPDAEVLGGKGVDGVLWVSTRSHRVPGGVKLAQCVHPDLNAVGPAPRCCVERELPTLALHVQ
mmetsp:Transcript_171034/g.415701  ORF Transcript_171034/g.415701 Transcript_171034/m.415701 type:complete len:308 (-) Transcript_171034:149-1072(-)